MNGIANIKAMIEPIESDGCTRYAVIIGVQTVTDFATETEARMWCIRMGVDTRPEKEAKP